MNNLLTSDQQVLSGLISIIKKHWNEFDKKDLELLHEIKNIITFDSYSVFNWAKDNFDENRINRDNYGKFASKGTSLIYQDLKPEEIKFLEEEIYPKVEKAPEGVKLTERETEYLELAAGGYSIEETAEKLSVEKETVKRMRTNIFCKLGANKIQDATALAIQYGLLNPFKIKVKIDKDKYSINATGRDNITLNETEINLLHYMAAGLIRDNVDKYWTKSKWMVKSIQNDILRKFAVNKSVAAIALAFQHKLIDLEKLRNIRKQCESAFSIKIASRNKNKQQHDEKIRKLNKDRRNGRIINWKFLPI